MRAGANQPSGFLVLLLVLLASSRAQSQTAAWHNAIAKVTVRADLNRVPGTAFVVALKGDTAFLVTAAHVVAGDAKPLVEFVAGEKPYPATTRDVQGSDERGLALLAVSNPPPQVRVLPPAAQPKPVIGEKVTVAGFPAPFGKFLVVDTTIAGPRGLDVILSRETGEGFSGGPVLREGTVVGLVFGREGAFGLALVSDLVKLYLEGHEVVWGDKTASTSQVSPTPGQVRTIPADGQPYVWIPPGEFQMGCSAGDNECGTDENPSHNVQITRGFWLGQTEVTQAAYQKVIGTNPSSFQGLQHPVEKVSWDDALRYCKAVGGRLPTEAEWEYAARAGSQQTRFEELDNIAWYSSNSTGKTHPVGQKQKNGWGLYDMLGNVWEWVSDWYQEDYYKAPPLTAVDPQGPLTGRERVSRGGSWKGPSRQVRASARNWFGPGGQAFDIGFRCVREVVP